MAEQAEKKRVAFVSTRIAGTAVFAIYVADALGYTGSVGVILFRNQMYAGVSRLEFFTGFTYFMSLLGGVMLVASCLYFLRRHAHREDRPWPAE